jgi:hypothetical protein
MAEGNGYDKQSWAALYMKIEAIDLRTQNHGECFDTMREELSAISKNTGVVADFFQALREDNRELSRIAAGKNQVPLYLVVVGLVFISIYILVDQLRDSGLDLNIPWLGVSITHTEKAHDAATK